MKFAKYAVSLVAMVIALMFGAVAFLVATPPMVTPLGCVVKPCAGDGTCGWATIDGNVLCACYYDLSAHTSSTCGSS